MELQPSSSADGLYPGVRIDGQALQDWRHGFGDRTFFVLADYSATPVHQIQVVVQLEGQFVRGVRVFGAREWQQSRTGRRVVR